MTTYNKNITVDTLKFLKEKFEQVDGKDFKLHYVKMVLPANTTEASRKKIWSVLWGDDQSHRWPEYTQYPLFELAEDTEPSHIVYGALVGTNVAEGCFAIESLMKETVKRLLLRNYEPESMPDSNTFLDNFWRFADTLEEYEIPIQHQAGEVYLWFEFLFKLSKEQRSFITADYLLSCLYMKELPCVPKIQGLKTDALKASILALDYLLSKAEQRYKQPKEQKVQERKIKPVKEILLDSIRSAYMELERLSEKPLNLDGLTSEEIAYAEAAVIEYLTKRFGEQDDALGNWPSDWHECHEAFDLYKAKIREFRELKTKASLEQVKSIAEAQTTKKPTQTTQEMNKGELRKVEVAKEFVSVVDEALQLISQTDDLNTTLRSEQVQNLAAKINVLGQECDLLEEYQKVGLDANSYYQEQYTYDTCIFLEELGNFEWSVPKELRLLREKAKLFVNKAPAEIVQKTKAVKKLQAEKRGRPRVYTDDQLKRMLDSYDEFYEETKDSKAAWNKVAKHHGAKNGDAARVACMNYRKRLKKSK